jgi:hypothetical protein
MGRNKQDAEWRILELASETARLANNLGDPLLSCLAGMSVYAAADRLGIPLSTVDGAQRHIRKNRKTKTSGLTRTRKRAARAVSATDS